MQFYAHTLDDVPAEYWEPLEIHLRNVAEGEDGTSGAAAFAASFDAHDWGRIAGLWHDIGKYSSEFQQYLQHANDDTKQYSAARVDHSTAGAQHAVRSFPGSVGRLLAYCIAGHHGGLPDDQDATGGKSGLAPRLEKQIPYYSSAPSEVLNQPPPPQLSLTWADDSRSRAFQLSVFCRMLFSCLVDADYLATEAFMRPARSANRPAPDLKPADLVAQFDTYVDQMAAGGKQTEVNRRRAEVLEQCRAAAELPRGLFSLTVPTGGGKTLSSLAFALRHAALHDLRRVIYAIPFTSIIEQNAEVFRRALNDASQRIVLEHHSNFDSPESRDESSEAESQTPWHRLAAENWEAPVVVTTNVQLFESLFASKPSRCRKLHRIARSIIILDECQTLPVNLLHPTLSMLDELCRNYGCTVVLCSATQPAVQRRDGFPIGLEDVREIVRDPPGLYQSLTRVRVNRVGKLADEELADELRKLDQVLCVVNTRAHAARLFTLLCEQADPINGLFHLSTQMCAAHRSAVLRLIRSRLRRGDTCRVVSTQLIEAGVDVDFPTAYRAMTGLDSIAQAAGRCNREGRREYGDVFVFDTDVNPRGDLRLRRQVAEEIAPEHEDLLSLEAMEHFFRQHFWSRKETWDEHEILSRFSLRNTGLRCQFREVAEKYRLIFDNQQPVIVPYCRRGRALVDRLRRMHEPPGRSFDRQLQRYSVGVYDWQFHQLLEKQAIAPYQDRFFVLENTEAYDANLGLQLNPGFPDPCNLVI